MKIKLLTLNHNVLQIVTKKLCSQV